MIITEEYRRNLYPLGLRERSVSEDVLKAAHSIDSRLCFLYNIDDEQWEIYRIKQKGQSPQDDLLHWQISIKNNLLTPGVVRNYLQKCDTNPGGLYTKDEMFYNWLKRHYSLKYKKQQIDEKKWAETERRFDEGKRYMTSWPVSVSVPIQVGYNMRTGKKVFAVPRVIRNA